MARSNSLLFAVLLTATGGFLDAYTFLTRGVFATAQTGNVILMTVNMASGKWHLALEHVWPILAFIAGVAIASFIKSERGQRASFHPTLIAIGAHALVLVGIGFLPESVPNAFVTIPIAYIAAIQISLFRQFGSLAYISIATTGNLMRLVEGTYGAFVDHDKTQRTAAYDYLMIVIAFAGGAGLGAVTTHFFHTMAVWIPACVVLGTLVLAYLDEREAGAQTSEST